MKRERGRGFLPQCRGCPRNCERTAASDKPLTRSGLGRRRRQSPQARRPAGDGNELADGGSARRFRLRILLWILCAAACLDRAPARMRARVESIAGTRYQEASISARRALYGGFNATW